MNSTRFRIAVPVLALAAAGCALDWPELEGLGCEAPSDCVENYQCIDGVCVFERIRVTETFPPDGHETVSPGEVLRVTFNKPVEATELAEPGRFVLLDEQTSRPIAVVFRQVENAPRVIEIDPEPELEYGARYTAVLGRRLTSTAGDTLGTEHAWSFRVADPAWRGTEVLSPDDAAPHHLVVAAFEGRRTVAWLEEWTGGVVFRTWEGAEWTPPDRLQDASVGALAVGGSLCLDENPCLAWETQGRIMLAHREGDGFRSLRIPDREHCSFPVMTTGSSGVAFLQSGKVWHYDWAGLPTNGHAVNQTPTLVVLAPILRAAGTDRLIAWEEGTSEATTGMIAPIRFPGQRVSDAVDAGSLRVAMAPGGVALLHWLESGTLTLRTYVNGNLGPIYPADDIVLPASESAAVVGKVGGHLAWVDGNNILVQPVKPPAEWGNGGFVAGPAETFEVNGPGQLRLAADHAGNALLLWTENDDALYARRWNVHTGEWEPSVQLDVIPDFRVNISDLQLAMEAPGRAVVVWLEGGKVWAARFE